MGWGANFVTDLSAAFHDYGLLWTPEEMIFAIGGEPVAAVVTKNSVNAPAGVMFSSAATWSGKLISTVSISSRPLEFCRMS